VIALKDANSGAASTPARFTNDELLEDVATVERLVAGPAIDVASPTIARDREMLPTSDRENSPP
jgi:hypothetical protein